jgi:tripeptidyl-peptidase I
MVSRLLVLSALFSLALAKPHARSMKVHESLEQVPSGFVKTSDPNANTPIKLRIALVQNNPTGLVDALYAVSDPASSSYGQHLTKEEVCDFGTRFLAWLELTRHQIRSSSLCHLPRRALTPSMLG